MIHVLQHRIKWCQEEKDQAEIEQHVQDTTEKGIGYVDIELKDVRYKVQWHTQTAHDTKQVNKNSYILCFEAFPVYFTLRARTAKKSANSNISALCPVSNTSQ